jgi:putative hemolysin
VKTEIASLAFPALLGFDIPGFVQGAAKRLLAIDGIIAIYEKVRAGSIPAALLCELDVTVHAAGAERIPAAGPAVVVANHPFGLLDGAIVAALCLRVRCDVRVLANDILRAIPELADLVLPVDVFTRKRVRQNAASMLEAIRYLANGGLLIVFPSGEVSRRSGDAQWNPRVARLIAAAAKKTEGLRIIPTFVHGANSRLFRFAGAVHPAVRTALLPRELLNKRGVNVRVDFGTPVAAERLLAMQSDEERIEYLRWRAHLLRRDTTFKPQTRNRVFSRTFSPTASEEIGSAVPVDVIDQEIGRLVPESSVGSAGDLRAYIATADQIPHTLREIGRLREITFREAGEGTGKSIDIDEFDQRYLHLFVWNSATRVVVDAYRIGRVDEIRRKYGPAGLYTATLFSFGDEFLNGLGPALELGRSFVRREYQRTFAPLLLLWKGIGRYVAKHPRYKVLFGPVSISNSYNAASRELMVAYLERRSILRGMVAMVKSRNPFRTRAAHVPATVELNDVSEAITDIEGTPAGIPVLLRQYLMLGGKLVGFNVDHEFSDAVDGLIVVDLTKTDKKLVERYLGRAEGKAFLELHRGEHGANENDLHSELDPAGHRRGDPAADTFLQIQRRPGVGLYLLDAWRRAVGQNQ